MKLFTVSSLLLLASLCPAVAQRFFTPGYAVTTGGDTLKGEIRQKKNDEMLFRASEKDPVTTYSPRQINLFSTEGHLTVARQWEEDGKETMAFLREELRGYVTLFSLLEESNGLGFVLQTPDGTLTPLRGQLAWAKLSRLCSDCSDRTLATYLEPGAFRYTLPYFVQVIRRYNRCKQPQATVVAKRTPFHYEFGLLAGLSRTQWNYRFSAYQFIDPRGPYSAHLAPNLGAFVTMFSNKRLSLSLELWYSQYTGSRATPITAPGFEEKYVTYQFRERFIAMPLLANFTLVNKPTRVYLKAGVLTSYDLKVEGEFSNPSYSIDNAPLRYDNGLGFGLLGGVGAEWKVSERYRLRTEVRSGFHVVRDGVTTLANCRTLQVLVAMPLSGR